MEKEWDTKEWDTIDVECDGWRTWERLGNEVLDWEGVIDMNAGASAIYLLGSNFSIDLIIEQKNSKGIFEKLISYRGIIKVIWTRSAVIMEQFERSKR